jgi:Ribbon-helix-helix protein, copG family
MSLKRTNVYADPEDLALIKQTAARRGVPEAEIIREGIHLAAMSTRVWDEPLDWPTFEGSGEPVTNEEISQAVAKNTRRG